MKVTSKGRVTIPKKIRDDIGLRPGDEVDFQYEDGWVYIIPRNCARRGRTVVEHLKGKGTVTMTTDEIMRLTRPEWGR